MCLLCILLLTACAPPTPPIEETTTDTPSGNETTLAPPDEELTSGLDEEISLENNTTMGDFTTEYTKPTAPIYSSDNDPTQNPEHPANIDILNPIPYKAYPLANHNFIPFTNSGYYNYDGKLKNNTYKIVEETGVPPYTITINGAEFIGYHSQTKIYNMNGKIGSPKRTYKSSDTDFFVIDVETDEMLSFYIDYDRKDNISSTISEDDAFLIAKTFVESHTQLYDQFDAENYRYSITFKERYGFASYYQIEYQRYINEIPTAEKFRIYVNLHGDIYFY